MSRLQSRIDKLEETVSGDPCEVRVVSSPEEGKELRRCGFRGRVLVLEIVGPPPAGMEPD